MCYIRSLLQLICLSFVVVEIVNASSFRNRPNDISRIRRQAANSNCPGFACKSGECINENKECDGSVDCQDGSDETNACHRLKCPAYLFRCKYGACISFDLECDGKPDCKDGSDENSSKCKNILPSQNCTSDQFQCSSGQCIDEDFKCDGVAQCADHSDEISATCWNIRCPGFTYRCNYGACVNGDAECNGKVECYDGSDEDPKKCKTTPTPPTVTTPTPPPVIKPGPAPPGSCILPEHPNSGQWSIYGAPAGYSPGMSVVSGTVLQVGCNKSHKLDGNAIILCKAGKWSSHIGRCLKICSPIYSTPTMSVTCTFNDKETENCTEAFEGTLAKFKCAHFYEDLGLSRTPVHICRDGMWDQRKPNCVPECGKKSVSAQTLIINGTNVTKGDYPWQVAIYTVQDQILICGGSLINQRVILTAAHCITDEKGKMLSKELYVVAVGKYYRNYTDSRDANEAQFSPVKEMFIPVQYKGAVLNFLGDIAILVTEKTFTLSRRVQPVCVDWGLNYENRMGSFGYVTGWGYIIQHDQPSDVLKELKVPPVTYEQCSQGLPPDYEGFLTYDKLCAGYLDKSTSVCRGDSGGGLVFKHDGRYYITGIVSLSPQAPTEEGGCDSQQYGLYTKVSTYISNFILKKESHYRP